MWINFDKYDEQTAQCSNHICLHIELSNRRDLCMVLESTACSNCSAVLSRRVLGDSRGMKQNRNLCKYQKTKKIQSLVWNESFTCQVDTSEYYACSVKAAIELKNHRCAVVFTLTATAVGSNRLCLHTWSVLPQRMASFLQVFICFLVEVNVEWLGQLVEGALDLHVFVSKYINFIMQKSLHVGLVHNYLLKWQLAVAHTFAWNHPRSVGWWCVPSPGCLWMV